jgi:hypothetical protein
MAGKDTGCFFNDDLHHFYTFAGMKRYLGILLIAGCCFWLLTHPVQGQTPPFSVMFYNVENLFDTIDDPLTNDAEFLPGGRYQWAAERYQTKLNQLARVISADEAGDYPAIIGLCETENIRVLKDLVAHPLLDGFYHIVHYDSPDGRGIDVALLYRDAFFRVITSAPLQVRVPFDLDFRTRDILYVQGVAGEDTLHIYVNHWSSRRGGTEVSEPKRVRSAEVLRNHLDSVAQHFNKFNAIIMGDLNDEPHNRSVAGVLGAIRPGAEAPSNAQKPVLYNLAMTIPEGEGTYYYWRDKKWNILDQIIVTASLADSTHRHNTIQSGHFSVIRPNWLLKEDQGALIPFSTFARDYQGGYSDHLPVKVTFTLSAPPPPPRKWKWRKR